MRVQVRQETAFSRVQCVRVGARLLYNYLVKGGVQVFEYRRRPLHGKVALMDDHWATVGSSNLDPLSLSLNLEANVIIHDRHFNQTLRDNLNVGNYHCGDERNRHRQHYC